MHPGSFSSIERRRRSRAASALVHSQCGPSDCWRLERSRTTDAAVRALVETLAREPGPKQQCRRSAAEIAGIRDLHRLRGAPSSELCPFFHAMPVPGLPQKRVPSTFLQPAFICGVDPFVLVTAGGMGGRAGAGVEAGAGMSPGRQPFAAMQSAKMPSKARPAFMLAMTWLRTTLR